MNREKPTVEEYPNWLQEVFFEPLSKSYENFYQTVTLRMKSEFENSLFWQTLLENLREYNDEYYQKTSYQLIRSFDPPTILIKPFESFLLKTYRKNILENKNWPEPPSNGWYLPDNWFLRVSDTLRTLIEVKYLDGVEFLINKIKILGQELPTRIEAHLEARDEGYYAAHLYVSHIFEIPNFKWDTQHIDTKVEIQITTQLQEVIRQLLHSYYEEARKTSKKSDQWQWDFRSNEFAANYLGHILHYLEGIIVEVRDEQSQIKKEPFL
jgi:hypothetical protein